MGGPKPNFASGIRSSTAPAMTCAVEWRSAYRRSSPWSALRSVLAIEKRLRRRTSGREASDASRGSTRVALSGHSSNRLYGACPHRSAGVSCGAAPPGSHPSRLACRASRARYPRRRVRGRIPCARALRQRIESMNGRAREISVRMFGSFSEAACASSLSHSSSTAIAFGSPATTLTSYRRHPGIAGALAAASRRTARSAAR